METQKIINLLNDSSNEESKFATKKWYVIDSQTTKGKYKQGDAIKFETELLNQVFVFKVYLQLNWIEDCILSSAGDSAKCEITDAKLHVPIVTLSTKDSENLTKQLNEGFKRSVYLNSYETKPATVIEIKALRDYLFLLILLL